MELRADPLFQQPWNENEIPVQFEGGATCDELYSRLHEKKTFESLSGGQMGRSKTFRLLGIFGAVRKLSGPCRPTKGTETYARLSIAVNG